MTARWQTWIDFTICGHSICIDDALETCCERVDWKQCRWRGGGRQAVIERVDTTSALPLMVKKIYIFKFKIVKRGKKTWCLISSPLQCFLTPPSLRALCSSGSWATGHQASAIKHLSVTEGLQRFSTIWTALHFWTRTFHWGSTATTCISICCRKVSVCDSTWKSKQEILSIKSNKRRSNVRQMSDKTLTDWMSSIRPCSPWRISSLSVGLSGYANVCVWKLQQEKCAKNKCLQVEQQHCRCGNQTDV